MIIVTGGLGFIGSNIVHILNANGREDVIVVDDFSDGTKFVNIADARIADYMEKDEFLKKIAGDRLDNVEAVLHQGACSTTTEWDGTFMMANNYRYSKELLHYCLNRQIPFLYASSASVYGGGATFVEDPQYERPLNVYAYSKTLFDHYVRRILTGKSRHSQVAGFRYFNVYGPREQHKGSMASVAFHLHKQLEAGDEIRLFAGCDGYGDGEQRRDFVYVDDVVEVLLWFMAHPECSGIFNVGTGKSQSFNDVAQAVLASYGRGSLRYIPFPDHLKGRYQSFTQANISHLRQAGYTAPFRTVEEGVSLYMDWLRSGQR